MNYMLKFSLPFIIALLSISGCQENQQINSGKKQQLQAHTNYKLSVQLSEKDKTIASLKSKNEQLQKKLKKQTKLAEKCMNGKGNEFMEMITPLMTEMNQLKEENLQLKSKIDELNIAK